MQHWNRFNLKARAKSAATMNLRGLSVVIYKYQSMLEGAEATSDGKQARQLETHTKESGS